ncbi:PorP/SprF family type IX secretion system membrane protein [Marinoscillum furvescens]|nr:type IX secretion system membrane protein PorP/SprF [Marinoscillum furvescens]
MKIIVFSMVFGCWSPNTAHAQDPQFSQYYAAPMYLNPGLVGINQKGRAGINYRNQWPQIDANYRTYSFYIDYFFEEEYSALGLIVNRDEEGIAGLQSTNIGLQYAYQVNLTYDWTFRPGVEVSYYWRDINFSELTFGDQFDNTGQVRPVSSEAFNTGMNAQFVDLAFGGVLYNGKMWAGAAMHHVLEPNQSLAGGESPLPRKFSLHGGYKILFSDINPKARRPEKGRERSFTPSINYKQQGSFKQLDAGIYFTLEPVLLGAWYRGIPIDGFTGTKNSESIISMIGFNTGDLTIGYSFDYTISDLGIGSGGAHEVSIIYAFSLADPRKPSREVRELRCPVPFLF